jgi:hypothetical protein
MTSNIMGDIRRKLAAKLYADRMGLGIPIKNLKNSAAKKVLKSFPI